VLSLEDGGIGEAERHRSTGCADSKQKRVGPGVYKKKKSKKGGLKEYRCEREVG